jgi:hypothetical protein
MGIATKLKFRLRCLRCLLNSEYQGDEIYLKYNGRKIWPEDRIWYRVFEGEEVVMNVTQPVANIGDKVELELWECDLISHSKLGNFNFLVDAVYGTYTVDMVSENSTAKYSLVWDAIQ